MSYKYEMLKILIIGVNSFSGSTLAKYLQKKKNIQLFGIYHSEKNNKYIIYDKRKIILKKINNLKYLKIAKFIKEIKPDHIIDFASICMVNESWELKKYYNNVNYLSKKKLFNEIKKLRYIKKYIYISTPEVFGSSSSITESSNKFNPSTPYAESKMKTELLIRKYYQRYSFPAIILRFSNFYGPGQPIFRLIPKVCMCLEGKTNFPLHGDGLTRRNFIYSEDFSRGIYLSIIKGKVGGIYHFSGSETYSIKKIINKICKLKKKKFDTFVKFNKERLNKDKIYKLDYKLTKKELNWQPKITLDSGLKQTIKFYKKNFNFLKKENFEFKFRA